MSTTAIPRAAEPTRLLAWATVAAVSAPLAILLHELGHYLAAAAFGFPGRALHYASATSAAGTAGFPAWQLGVEAAAGPFVTLAIVAACSYAVHRLGPRPWVVAPAFAAGVRTAVLGSAYLFVRLRRPAATLSPNFDEFNVARAFGAPPELLVALSVLLILTAWLFLFRRMARGQRALPLLAIAVGAATGIALYGTMLGPALLP